MKLFTIYSWITSLICLVAGIIAFITKEEAWPLTVAVGIFCSVFSGASALVGTIAWAKGELETPSKRVIKKILLK